MTEQPTTDEALDLPEDAPALEFEDTETQEEEATDEA